jgi:hypothetical protein
MDKYVYTKKFLKIKTLHFSHSFRRQSHGMDCDDKGFLTLTEEQLSGAGCSPSICAGEQSCPALPVLPSSGQGRTNASLFNILGHNLEMFKVLEFPKYCWGKGFCKRLSFHMRK